MSDPRDKYVPKHATPAQGSSTSAAEIERRDRLHGGRANEATPVDMPLPGLIARTDTRTKAMSETTLDIHARVGHLERGLGDARLEVQAVALRVENLDGKVDTILAESTEQRRERVSREERQATSAEAELERRSKRNLAIIGIVVPTLIALTGLLAGLAGAFR